MEGRVIKFRVYHDGKMYNLNKGNNLQLIFFSEGIPWGLYDSATEERYVTGDPEAIFNTPGSLIQFTGLLDKTGKEIYEGDILKFVDHNHETRHIGPVVWGRYEMGRFDIPTWTANNGNRGGIGLFPANFKKPIVDIGEVIGNIYENPELLK